jgi:hypothetical protein
MTNNPLRGKSTPHSPDNLLQDARDKQSQSNPNKAAQNRIPNSKMRFYPRWPDFFWPNKPIAATKSK